MTAPTATGVPDAGAVKRGRLRRRLDRLRLAMIGALAIQLLLGMSNNLWLRQSHPTLDRAAPASLLSAHVTWAYLLMVLAVWMFVDAVRLRRSPYLVPAAAGLAGVLLAYTAGSTYYNNEHAIWSFLMTLGFTIAVTSYAAAGRKWAGS